MGVPHTYTLSVRHWVYHSFHRPRSSFRHTWLYRENNNATPSTEKLIFSLIHYDQWKAEYSIHWKKWGCVDQIKIWFNADIPICFITCRGLLNSYSRSWVRYLALMLYFLSIFFFFIINFGTLIFIMVFHNKSMNIFDFRNVKHPKFWTSQKAVI